MSDYYVPDMIEPIVAYRGWNVGPDLKLQSLNQWAEWGLKERMEARCIHAEPSTVHVHGWWCVTRHKREDRVWLRDSLDDVEVRRELQLLDHGMTFAGPTGPAMTAAMSVGMDMQQSAFIEIQEPLGKPSDLVLPYGWEFEFGYREEMYPPRHGACPGENCACGIYALDDLGVVRRSYSASVLGEVYLWGKVVMGERGYRAQYAYPKKLVVRSGAAGLADALHAAYGVEVEIESAAVAIAKAIPTHRTTANTLFAIGLLNFMFIVMNVAMMGIYGLTWWRLLLALVSAAATMFSFRVGYKMRR